MSQKVNIDYVAVIQKVDDHVKFVQKTIPQKDALLSDLKEMIENPDRTVLDLKSRMDLEFSESERKGVYCFISPYSYSTYDVTGVSYPKCMSYDEYRADMDLLREKKQAESEKAWDYLRVSKPDDFRENVKFSVDNVISLRVKDLKKRFLFEAERFTNAYCYTKKVQELKSDPSVRMYSTEAIGWMTKSFVINEDIKITVDTNFGYGRSSYFLVQLRYKGIDILPFSHFVNYYYADKRDIARYTRRYNECNSSWDYAFEFVENVTNKAGSDECNFVNEFIRNEVNEMMSGLRSISANPSAYMDKMVSSKNLENPSHYLSVRNISDDEIIKFKAYPHEMAMVFEAEKISGALLFIESLKKLSQVDDMCNTAIDEIISLAKNLMPRLEHNITSIKKDVEILKKQEEILDTEIKDLESRIEPHKVAINTIYEHRLATEENVSAQDVVVEYKKTHQEYAALLEDKHKKEEKKSEINRDRWARIAFQEKLEEFKSDIETEGLINNANNQFAAND